jgi:hypothetical protein
VPLLLIAMIFYRGWAQNRAQFLRSAYGLPNWPHYEPTNSYQVMHLRKAALHSLAEMNRERYEFLDTEANGAMRPQHDPGTE